MLELVPREGFEPTHPYGYCALNAARLPFRHLGLGSSGRCPAFAVPFDMVGDGGLEPPTSSV